MSPNTAAVTRCPANAGFLLGEAAVFSGTLKRARYNKITAPLIVKSYKQELHQTLTKVAAVTAVTAVAVYMLFVPYIFTLLINTTVSR